MKSLFKWLGVFTLIAVLTGLVTHWHLKQPIEPTFQAPEPPAHSIAHTPLSDPTMASRSARLASRKTALVTDRSSLLALMEAGTLEAGEAARSLVHDWAQIDPAAAAASVSSVPATNKVAGAALAQVAMSWAERDAVGALSWAQGLPESIHRDEAIVAAGWEAARTEPALAFQSALQLEGGADRDTLLVHAVKQWAQEDSASAFHAIDQIPVAALQQRLLSAMAVATAEHDAHAAATLAVSRLQPGDIQNRTVVGIIQRWVQHTPADAAAWVAEFPDGPLRSVALESMIGIWKQTDPAASGKWLTGLPPGGFRESAVRLYNSGIVAR
jgi:hypothetical protein